MTEYENKRASETVLIKCISGIRALEVHDSFNPERVLEVRFVLPSSQDGWHYDGLDRNSGFTRTGRTFRSSYLSLRQILGRCAFDESEQDKFIS